MPVLRGWLSSRELWCLENSQINLLVYSDFIFIVIYVENSIKNICQTASKLSKKNLSSSQHILPPEVKRSLLKKDKLETVGYPE